MIAACAAALALLTAVGRHGLFVSALPFPQQEFFGNADVDKVPGEQLVFIAMTCRVEQNIQTVSSKA